MIYQTLEVCISDAVATVCLNRPDVRNAFNEVMIEELTNAFLSLGSTQAVRVIVLSAAGGAFCAGADLNWMKKMAGYTYEENKADAARLAEMLRTIHECPKPVIARIQGDCYAGGVGLAAAADISVAVSSANFCLSEVRLGLIPATISPYVIGSIGSNSARRYFLTAERFGADEAKRIGLVHECVAPELLDAAITALTEAICANGPNGVRAAKALVRDVGNRPITKELVTDTVLQIAELRASAEAKEGIQSFLEKRQPAWRIH